MHVSVCVLHKSHTHTSDGTRTTRLQRHAVKFAQQTHSYTCDTYRER